MLQRSIPLQCPHCSRSISFFSFLYSHTHLASICCMKACTPASVAASRWGAMTDQCHAPLHSENRRSYVACLMTCGVCVCGGGEGLGRKFEEGGSAARAGVRGLLGGLLGRGQRRGAQHGWCSLAEGCALPPPTFCDTNNMRKQPPRLHGGVAVLAHRHLLHSGPTNTRTAHHDHHQHQLVPPIQLFAVHHSSSQAPTTSPHHNTTYHTLSCSPQLITSAHNIPTPHHTTQTHTFSCSSQLITSAHNIPTPHHTTHIPTQLPTCMAVLRYLRTSASCTVPQLALATPSPARLLSRRCASSGRRWLKPSTLISMPAGACASAGVQARCWGSCMLGSWRRASSGRRWLEPFPLISMPTWEVACAGAQEPMHTHQQGHTGNPTMAATSTHSRQHA